MKQADIIAMAKSRIKGAEEYLVEFAANLVKNPEYTVYWSMPLFSKTADLTVWKQVLHMAEGGCDLSQLIETLEEYLISGAARPSNSSSFSSNHLEQGKLRAYAEAYRYFKRHQRLYAEIKESSVTLATTT
jgi:hypothetical protein